MSNQNVEKTESDFVINVRFAVIVVAVLLSCRESSANIRIAATHIIDFLLLCFVHVSPRAIAVFYEFVTYVEKCNRFPAWLSVYRHAPTILVHH